MLRAFSLIVIGFVLLTACNQDSGLFDPEKQKERDIETLQKHFAEKGLSPQYHNKGLFYIIHEPGSGRIPTAGNTLVVNYTGYFLDGSVFDTNLEQVARTAGIFNPARSYVPFTFRFRDNPPRVIEGWDIGFEFLKENGRATLFLTSGLGYGNRSVGSIPPNSILVFDVELLQVRP